MATPSRLRLLLLGCCILAGCNLNDYEARMQRAQEAMKFRDDEHKLLDEQVAISAYPAAPPADIFLRLPLGINPQAKDPEKPFGGLLFQHVRKAIPAPTPPPPPQPGQPNPPPAPSLGLGPASTLLDVFIAYRTEPRPGQTLIDEVTKQFPQPTKEPTKRAKRCSPPGREPFTVDILESHDLTNSYLYASRSTPNIQVVVVYRLEKDKLAASLRAIEASVQTLGIDDEVVPAREAFANDYYRRPPR